MRECLLQGFERFGESLAAEWLEQVVERAELACGARVLLVSAGDDEFRNVRATEGAEQI